MQHSVIIVDGKDNVATASRQLEEGNLIRVPAGGGNTEILLRQAIPAGHKLALQDIETGGPIVKYGEVIGLATRRITRGDHVHVHNVEGLRGRGDKL